MIAHRNSTLLLSVTCRFSFKTLGSIYSQDRQVALLKWFRVYVWCSSDYS